MMNLSPKARRFINEAFRKFPDPVYRDMWSSADQVSLEPIVARSALAALSHLSAILEFELTKPDLSSEDRTCFSNDLWFVSDLISEISDSLPTGQIAEHDPYLPSLIGGGASSRSRSG
jgi:hypothetical protein